LTAFAFVCLCLACCRYVDTHQQEVSGAGSAGASGHGAQHPYGKANVRGFIRRMAIPAEQLGSNLDGFWQHGAPPFVPMPAGWPPGCGPCVIDHE
jgi:hypothetical protein